MVHDFVCYSKTDNQEENLKTRQVWSLRKMKFRTKINNNFRTYNKIVVECFGYTFEFRWRKNV